MYVNVLIMVHHQRQPVLQLWQALCALEQQHLREERKGVALCVMTGEGDG